MSEISSDTYKEYVTIDEQPSGDTLGYWTNEVDPRELQKKKNVKKIYFSIREYETDSSQASDTSSMTVSLQFKCDGDLGWQDYVSLDGSELAMGNRLVMEDFAANVKWRAGVKDGDYTSGSVTVGFDW